MGKFKDDLGKRMKEFYEGVFNFKLTRRTPVIIRLDGRAFHTWTRGMQKPFDMLLMTAMQKTMLELCKEIQGCVFGYTQSDEITLVLVDYKGLNTSAWFEYKIQKICSISASLCTLYFNKFFAELVDDFGKSLDTNNDFDIKMYKLYKNKCWKATFDARCFNIPKEEVCNVVYWRQLDASRNSVQMVAQANFSHNELRNKNNSQIQDMLMLQKGINWNDFSVPCKRGTSCILEETEDGKPVWKIDYNMPILKGDDRNYVERYIFV